MLAQLWDAGKLPYRDMFSTQFPGEVYILYLLGKGFGWGNTVAYYAFDAALVIAFLILLVVWGHRRTGGYLPGLIGGSTFLLYYVSQNTLVAGEREWHAGFLMTCSLLLLGLGSGRTMRLMLRGRFRSGDRCAAAGLCALACPLAGDRGSAQVRGESWKQSARDLFSWALVAAVVTAVGFLPLMWAGILGDFRTCVQVLLQPPYNTSGPLQVFSRMSPQKHPAVLLAVTPLIVLFWDRNADAGRRDAQVVLAALLGVLFYSAISPVRNAYHAIPQVAVAALGVTYLVIQILRFGGQQTRLTVGALALTFLFFGASTDPFR